MSREPSTFTRWPLLAAGAALLAAGVGVEWADPGSTVPGVSLLALSASCIGAFVYAEGARHREWWLERRDTPDEPPALDDDRER